MQDPSGFIFKFDEKNEKQWLIFMLTACILGVQWSKMDEKR